MHCYRNTNPKLVCFRFGCGWHIAHISFHILADELPPLEELHSASRGLSPHHASSRKVSNGVRQKAFFFPRIRWLRDFNLKFKGWNVQRTLLPREAGAFEALTCKTSSQNF